MAYEKKYNWQVIKKDYMAHKFKNAKELAEHYDINYGYLKKKTATWNKELKIAKQLSKIKKDTDDIDTLDIEELPNKDLDTINLNFNKPDELKGDYLPPGDRKERLLRLWDKLAYIVEASLNNAEFDFFTNDGKLKSKALSDISIILEKIQKANESNFEDNKTGSLNDYVEMFNLMKKNQSSQEEIEGVVDNEK